MLTEPPPLDAIWSNPFVLLLSAGLIWFGVQWLLSIVVLPYRNELRSLIAAIKSDHALSEMEIEFLDHLWQTAFAARSTITLSVVYVLTLITPHSALTRERDEVALVVPHIWGDIRMDRIIDCHFISIFVANPIFGFVCIILRAAWRVKIMRLTWSFVKKDHYSVVPVLDALHRV